MTNRPPCPACHGKRRVLDALDEAVACTVCDDGYMRGVTDETPEERRIAELEARETALREWLERACSAVRYLRSMHVSAEWARDSSREALLVTKEWAWLDPLERGRYADAALTLLAESDSRGGGR